MKHRYRITALLTLIACLAGCAGNYASSDKDYRPLGDPRPQPRS